MLIFGGPESEIDLLAAAKVYDLSVARRVMRDGTECLEYCQRIWRAAKYGDAVDLMGGVDRENRQLKSCGARETVACDVDDMLYIGRFVDIPRSRVRLTIRGLIRLDADRRGLLCAWDGLMALPPKGRGKVASLIVTMYGSDVLVDDEKNPIAKVMRAEDRNVEVMFRMDDDEFENLVLSFDPVCMYPAFLSLVEDGVDLGLELTGDDF